MRKWKPNAKQRAAIREAKEARVAVERAKPKVCGACSGSGRYDDTGSPKCGACGGTGLTQQEA